MSLQEPRNSMLVLSHRNIEDFAPKRKMSRAVIDHDWANSLHFRQANTFKRVAVEPRINDNIVDLFVHKTRIQRSIFRIPTRNRKPAVKNFPAGKANYFHTFAKRLPSRKTKYI